MCQPSPMPLDQNLESLEKRIKELNKKASQLLLFLSFALVVAAILETTGDKLGQCQTMLLTFGMRFWSIAIFPILIGILPVKEIRAPDEKWYTFIRRGKIVALWAAIIFIMIGTLFFACAIWRIGPIKW